MQKSNFFVAVASSFLLFTSTSAQAESVPVKRILPSCVSRELLDEILQYKTDRDKDGYLQVLATGQCVLLGVGDRVSVIDRGFMVATFRWRGIKWYTPIETIN